VTSDVPAASIEAHKAALAEGRHIFSALRMQDVEVDGADLAIELELDESLAGPRGALQGGLVATLADIVGGRLAMQSAGDDGIPVTTDLTVHYLAPVQTGPAHAIGRVLRRGTRGVVVRVDVHDGPGGPLAAACTLAFTIVKPQQ
jgi:uncharacterized protein (TIGR00369 family)